MSLSVGGQQPEWPAGDQRRRRSHFLLRDISKHGCLQQEPSTVILTQGGKITSLWRHQSHRGQGMVGSEGSDVQSFLFSLYLPCCLFILLWLWIVCLSVWVEMSSGWDAGTASPLGVITPLICPGEPTRRSAPAPTSPFGTPLIRQSLIWHRQNNYPECTPADEPP